MLDVGFLEEKIGYEFSDKQLLKKAFTHSSYANAYGGESNERLEYLGDAVLQLVVSEMQYRASNDSEGDMTKDRQTKVRELALLRAVQALGVADKMLIAGSAANVGKKTVSSLYECIVGAIYLDGGFEKAKAFIESHPVHTDERNFKSELQELLQGRGKDVPVYETKKSGKDNAPVFYATAYALGLIGEGTGSSKKQAEQYAAEQLLALIKREGVWG